MSMSRRVAVSYDTATFHDLACYMPGIERITPDQLFTDRDADAEYINLVNRDLDLRRQISEFIDYHALRRFSYIHPTAVTTGASIGPGAMIYPGVVVYPNTTVGKDVLIHANTAIAHQVSIGDGVYISGGVTVGGRSTIGSWCMLGLGATIYDNVVIVDQVVIGASTTVRKPVNQAGTYCMASGLRLRQLK